MMCIIIILVPLVLVLLINRPTTTFVNYLNFILILKTGFILNLWLVKNGTNTLNFNDPKHLGLESFMIIGMHRVLELWVPDLPEGWWTF